MHRRALGFVVVVLMAFGGLTRAGEPGEKIKSYLLNRYKDLRDVFSIKVCLNSAYSFKAYLRFVRWAQVGIGESWGTKVGLEKCGAGVYSEGRSEYALIIPVSCSITRKVFWQDRDAEERNLFFADVGEEGVFGPESMKEYYDGNRSWLTSSIELQLPVLPGLEFSIHWAEAVDFVLSILGLKGIRVPPPFYKHRVEGEDIPEPESLHWHGQRELESF